MNLLTDAAAKALKSLLIPGMLRIFLYSVLLTMAALALFAAGVRELLHAMTSSQNPDIETIMNIGGTVGSLILSWILFPLLLPVIVSFFDEKIADRVEHHFYKDLPIPQYPFWPTLWQDVRFSLWAVFLNIICLPLYLIPLVNLVLYYLLNGYLLGQQFFRMAAGRHINRPQAEILMSRYRVVIIAGGAMIAFSSTIPLLNIVSPFLGVAMMIHLFQALNGAKSASAIESER